jgi:hypothetical protein
MLNEMGKAMQQGRFALWIVIEHRALSIGHL